MLPFLPGPFYVTLAGPPGAFPNLDDPSALRQVAQVVRDSLRLGNNYPLDNIAVWLENQQDVPAAAAPPGRRHLLSSTNKVVVIGYMLVKTADLPPLEELQSLMDSTDASEQFAQKLADCGLLTELQLGQLVVCVTSVDKLAEVISAIQGTGGGDGATTILLVTVGESP